MRHRLIALTTTALSAVALAGAVPAAAVASSDAPTVGRVVDVRPAGFAEDIGSMLQQIAAFAAAPGQAPAIVCYLHPPA